MNPSTHSSVDAFLVEGIREMADHFFGSRRRLEEGIAILTEYARATALRGRRLRGRLAFFHRLLLDEATAAAFYRSVGVAPEPLLAAATPNQEERPASPPPTALTWRGRYEKTLRWGYDALHAEWREYISGSGDGGSPEEAGYQVVREMADILNRDIREINEHLSPETVLQRAASFDTDAQCLAHGMGCTLDRSRSRVGQDLSFRRIHLDELGVYAYPSPPSPAAAARAITDVTARLTATRAADIRLLLDTLQG